ncbi:sensor histidine kinase [Anaerocolumna sp. MB42-C2]|uniref:sensor histidine kinase n=1 Tax=Anaerocolumna sp. MB42-C2 TaxID=3070997 RepID=UPI0027E08E47|nr:histidine kinase [Anaerocolumna sp. MB42-C2]WMJ89949.1 histidine kinase [Anaerocolumna sp. MB42-C2]
MQNKYLLKIKNFYQKCSHITGIGIRECIILSFILLVIIPFLALIAFSFKTFYNYACKESGTYMVTLLNSSKDQINSMCTNYVESAMTYYYNGTVELMGKDVWSEDTDIKLKTQLESTLNSYNGISAMFLEINGGIIHAGKNYQGFLDYVSKYKNQIVKAGGRKVWLPVKYFLPYSAGGYKFIMASDLNSSTEKDVGKLYIVVDAEDMMESFDKIEISGATTYLVDNSANIMYSSNRKQIGQKYVITGMDVPDTSGYYTSKINGVNSLVAYCKSYKTNWTEFIVIPMNVVLKDFKPIEICIIVISGIYFLCLFVLIWILERNIINPVRGLMEAMDSFAEGNFDIRVKNVVAVGEIKKLTHHFNFTIGRVKELMENFKAEEQEKNEFKLQALAAQMSPHFIYNSLNTIKWMAVINKQDNIRNLTEALIQILMNVSKRGNNNRICDEIGLIQHYAVLQKARFMNFDIDIQAEEAVKNLKIKKFLIQPIIENSIIHGFSRGNKSDGHIKIKIFRDDKLHIIIEDNGKGFDVEEWLKKENVTDNDHTNIGIQNIFQIIQLEYGEEYMITIKSMPNEGTVVEYLLPIMETED